MKTIHHFTLLITVIAGLASSGCSNAQYGSQQPGYQQPGYGQPGYNDPQSGYDNQQSYDDQGYNSPDFYTDLAPYGQWVQTPEYGRVWIPRAEPGFQPYTTNGHWVVTDYGNTWVSDYAWGWAPFHYGRWYYDNYRGWAWVPGNDWGPAWVSWRTGGGYYGWAPLGPGANVGVNININIAPNFWTFVPQIYITSPQVYNYCVPRPRVVNIYQNTTIINTVYRNNNRSYFYGPNRNDIERITRRPVQVYRIDNLDRPGRYDSRSGSVGFYRPELARNNGGRGTYNRPDTRSGSNYPPTGAGRPDNNPNGAGRGTYSAPFDNRPPATTNGGDRPGGDRPGSDRSGSDRRENNPNGAGRGTYSTPFDNRPSATPNPDNRSGNRSYPGTTPGGRDGVTPNQPSSGFDNRSSRGSYTPQPDRTGDNTPRQNPNAGGSGRGNGFGGAQPQQMPENRGGVSQQPRMQEQPQGRGTYQPQPRGQESSPRPEAGGRQAGAPDNGNSTGGGGARPDNGGRGSRGPR